MPGVPATAGAYPPPGTRDDVEFLTAVIDEPAGPAVEPVTEHVTRETYTTCRGRPDVVFYKVSGGTHGRARGNDSSATQEVSATELIWEFFTHYRR